MDKLWAGRFKSALNSAADDFNSSIRVDSRMYREDIEGSQAHVRMLASCGIVTEAEADAILRCLGEIRAELDDGRLEIDYACEDIHSFVEKTLTARIGDTGKKLHTARSRNDQVAVDTRLYLRRMADEEKAALLTLVRTLVKLAKENTETILPGYTHLQRAQPISFAQQLLAYANMFLRDLERLADCRVRINRCPLGAAALAGTTYPIDRTLTASLLGFDGICENSVDAVSDRDYIAELAFVNALIAMHVSRLAEEVTLWASYEFRFVELSDEFSTGSSIMPQKKNPDIAELARGKCGRVYGDLHALLTMLKGLPLAYNKDMQEDKEAVFDSVDTVLATLGVLAPMLETMTVRKDEMRKAADGGYINATDCADYLAKKGLPFRDAYKITGALVAYAIDEGKTLAGLSLDEYRTFSPLFEADVYEALDMHTCMSLRSSEGGTAPARVEEQIRKIEEHIHD